MTYNVFGGTLNLAQSINHSTTESNMISLKYVAVMTGSERDSFQLLETTVGPMSLKSIACVTYA